MGGPFALNVDPRLSSLTIPRLDWGKSRLRLRRRLPLDLADLRQCCAAVFFVPSRTKRTLKPDLALMEREGVAKASLHLCGVGFGFDKLIAPVRNRALDKFDELVKSQTGQMRTKLVSVK